MRFLSGVLILSLAGSATLLGQGSDPATVSAYLKTLPAISSIPLDQAEQERLAVAGISSTDHPQESPINRNNYLWSFQKPPDLLDGYDRNRAFFGCGNWHDAVGAMWMLTSILKQDPKISVSSDIKDIDNTHFRKANIDGEVAYFGHEPATPVPGGGGQAFAFERPYGYAWLMKLYGETRSWNNPDGRKLSVAVAPLARWMSDRLVFYIYDLKFPTRTGAESNTAWSMSLALDGAYLSENETLKNAIHDSAIRLYSKDKDCATQFEPQNADVVSPCLTEAALMGRVMDQGDYVKWLDAFLPPVYSDAFQVYAKGTDVSHTNTSGLDPLVQEAARAHLIALNFQRATEMLTVAYALPKDDARVAVLRRLAAIDAKSGYENLGIAGYEGQHLIAVYAMLYEDELKGPAPLAPPPRPKTAATEQSADAEMP